MKQYDNGIKHEKSALHFFAEKYVIDGKPGITPFQFFAEKASQLKELMRNHRNIKIMILVCGMEQQLIEKTKGKTKIYFNHQY